MSTPNLIRRKLLIAGRVQGVGFRESCRRVAVENGVAGYAKNLPDGRVEVALEGEPDAVAKVLEWCRVGPPHARVENVEEREEEARGEDGFKTR